MTGDLAKMIEKKYFGQKKKHWLEDSFFKQRVEILKKQLSKENSQKFAKMEFEKQKRVIAGLIHKGAMI